MNIAIASGKGGTGKTTLSTALARYCASRYATVALLDCDVEEPDANLFLKVPVKDVKPVPVPIPSVNNDLCTGCGLCEELCEFSAIVLIKGKPLVLPEMCHSCGGCALVCPVEAITEIPRDIGTIESGSQDNIVYAAGFLNPGESMAPPLIKEVKKYHYAAEMRIFDCPPGTSCPVIESVKDCDHLILVTEATPFGLNDLELAVNMAEAMALPFSVVINRCNTGFTGVDDFCTEHNVTVTARIPIERKLAESYSRGECTEYMLNNFKKELAVILEHCSQHNRRCYTI